MLMLDPTLFIAFTVIVVLTLLLGGSLATNWWLMRSRSSAQSEQTASSNAEAAVGSSDGKPATTTEPSSEGANEEKAEAAATSLNKVYTASRKLEDFYDRSAHPRDLLENAEFQQGVEVFCDPGFTPSELLLYATGDNYSIACMAFEALHRRSDEEDVTKRIIEALVQLGLQPYFFALRAIQVQENVSYVGAVLMNLNPYWDDDPVYQSIVSDFCKQRLAEGEKPSLKMWFDDKKEPPAGSIEMILKVLDLKELEPIARELNEWQRTRIDVEALKRIGTVWPENQKREAIIEHPALERAIKELRDAPSRAVLLIGKSGVGKTTMYTLLARAFQQRGWTIFEAGATELNAGQIYVGSLEGRIRELMSNLSARRKVLWIVPKFHELMYAGWHQNDPRSALDLLLPYIEQGDINIIGETEPEAYDRLLQYKPLLRSVLKGVFIEPLDDEETLALAREWNRAEHRESSVPLIEASVIEDAFFLARQFLDKTAAPGNLVNLLKWTQRNIQMAERPMTSTDVLHSLTQLTGLPTSILDQRQELDLEGLRTLFQQRVLGQTEAVDCLVERVAMIKAGLNDPTKPAGVFLFVGPTGTGKTEIAKTLAEFLFGSPDRMIRLDMSEFLSEQSLSRLIGDQERGGQARALVNLIRNQPFSVILLDEFEKAHPHVWDLFLQVFDDGRLTDRLGNTADFRHSIIIMTSNLGAAIPHGSMLGFSEDRNSFSESNVTRAVQTAFRPEFLNRIDRVVVFRPLGRSVVRDILLKELRTVLSRRGFRNRDWAVEWEESALEFLLDKGFTAALGARPLKRAIERFLLSPLAITIVQNQFPQGDQFLFVRSNGKELQVEFIDPDAPASGGDGAMGRPASEQATGPANAVVIDAGLSLKSLIMHAHGTPEEVDFLEVELDNQCEEVDSEAWELRKAAALARMETPAFWESNERFEVLDDVEYLDRAERALDTADSLFQRLKGENDETRTSYSTVLIKRLAHRLYVLQEAFNGDTLAMPRDAFITVEAVQDATLEADEAYENYQFAGRLARMYTMWAEKRQMRHKVLIKNEEEGGIARFVLAVAGLGAYPILHQETGLHVWETPVISNTFIRNRIRVRVAPQVVPVGTTTKQLLTQAETQFAAMDPVRTVVRRYREHPSPLVRDSVRTWRTGKLDLVLDGDFDMIS